MKRGERERERSVRQHIFNGFRRGPVIPSPHVNSRTMLRLGQRAAETCGTYAAVPNKHGTSVMLDTITRENGSVVQRQAFRVARNAKTPSQGRR
ncbi:hypothetical protein LX36DRAFT_29866 [Colletotrichum falcatum]|nr:hypothetical protein LX36DRAFT_29866 [Colletotrichum falcatum]